MVCQTAAAQRLGCDLITCGVVGFSEVPRRAASCNKVSAVTFLRDAWEKVAASRQGCSRAGKGSGLACKERILLPAT